MMIAVKYNCCFCGGSSHCGKSPLSVISTVIRVLTLVSSCPPSSKRVPSVKLGGLSGVVRN